MRKLFVAYLGLSLVSKCAIGTQRIEMLWGTPNAGLSLTSTPVVITDDTNKGEIKITTPTNFSAMKIDSWCSIDKISGVEADRVLYLAYPKNWVSAEGLAFTFQKLTASPTMYDESNIPLGYYGGYVSERKMSTGEATCSPAGSMSNSPIPLPVTNITIPFSIDRKNTWPGVYNVTIPLTIGMYEHFYSQFTPGVLGKNWFARANESGSRFNVNTNITVNSKCDISTKNIELDYGNISADIVHDRKISKNARVNCNYSSKVSLKILGGQVQNDGVLVPCGSNLECLVAINDKANIDIDMQGNEIRDFVVSSKLKVGGQVIPGHIVGNAVLEFIVH
ncbi:TPA: hypothetical protein ACGGLE_005262 [Escherichia coli]